MHLFAFLGARLSTALTPLLLVCGAWLAGVLAGNLTQLPGTLPGWTACMLALSAGACMLVNRPRLAAGLALPVLVLAGGWRAQLHREAVERDLLAGTRGMVSLRGVVAEEPERTDAALRWKLDVKQERLPGERTWRPVEGRVLVWSRPVPAVQYGDDVRLSGRLEDAPSFDTFDYAAYLARHGVHGAVRYGAVTVLAHDQGNPLIASALGVRRTLAASLARQLPEPQNALAQGILLGIRSGIPADMQDAFRRTGTTHILAISGQNMSVVSAMLIMLFRRSLSRRSWRFVLIAVPALWVYTLVVGAPFSVVRAAIMASLALMAGAMGREPYAAGGLLAAAVGITAWDPYALQDAGFQLSFGAMAGILVLAPPLQRRLQARLAPATGGGWARAAGGFVAEGTAATIAATVATLPIQALTFGQVTLLALPATLFALPPMAPLLPVAGVTGLLGLLPEPLSALAWPAAMLTLGLAWFMAAMVHLWSLLPLASVVLPPGDVTWVAAYLLALGGLWWWLARSAAPTRTAADFGLGFGALARARWPRLAAVGTGLLAAFVWWQVFLPDHAVRVSFLDVGEGDATLVQSGSGQRVLIDGGPSGPQLVRELSGQMPPWERTIDLVVLTNPKASNLSAVLDVLRRYEVRAVADSGLSDDTPEYREFERLVAERGIERVPLLRGAEVQLPDLTIRALHPTPAWLQQPESWRDDASLVLAMEAYGRRVLLPGDIGQRGELALMEREGSLQSAVLKVGSRGAKDSTSAALVDAVAPAAAVISAGARNQFHHPAPEVVARLGGAQLLRTDWDGTVQLTITPEGAVLTGARVRTGEP